MTTATFILPPSMVPAQNQAVPEDQRVSVVNPLCDAGWDAQIVQHPAATFFHQHDWLQVLHDTYGHEPLCLNVRKETGAPDALLPLLEVKSRLTGRRGVSLPFTDACEPLVFDADAMPRLFSAAIELGRKRHWKYVQFCGGRQFFPHTPASTAFHGHRLDLRRTESELWAAFDGATRRAIKKAEQSGVAIEFTRSMESVEEFYRLFCQTRKKHGAPPQPLEFFRNIQRHVLAKEHGWVVLARVGGAPVAGAVYFHSGCTVLYKFGASDESFQQTRANQMVMWRAIQRSAAEGFAALDFGRTSFGNEGLRRYKLNWGAVERKLEYFRYDLRRDQFVPAPDQAGGWHSHLFRRMPVPLLRLLGRYLYPHLG